jgi:hypothetical protein
MSRCAHAGRDLVLGVLALLSGPIRRIQLVDVDTGGTLKQDPSGRSLMLHKLSCRSFDVDACNLPEAMAAYEGASESRQRLMEANPTVTDYPSGSVFSPSCLGRTRHRAEQPTGAASYRRADAVRDRLPALPIDVRSVRACGDARPVTPGCCVGIRGFADSGPS